MTLLKLLSKSRMNSIYFQIIGKKTTTACGKAVELEPLSSRLTFIYVLHYGFSSQKVGPAGAGRRPLSDQLGQFSLSATQLISLKMISLLYVSPYVSFIARDWWPSFSRDDSLAIGWITLPNLNLWYTSCIIQSRHLNYYDPLYIFIFRPQILRILKKLKVHLH